MPWHAPCQRQQVGHSLGQALTLLLINSASGGR